jgi:inosine/xanthosine triphosphate pyrophosphatase family protein/dephospho-CoA kinase
MPRITTFRQLFAAPKQLEVRFHTSSTDKYLQARLIFHQSGMRLLHFKESQEPYHEDYHLEQKELFHRAINEIKHRLGVNSLFFVEDTSLQIDALSTGDHIVPGLEVKEWFARTSFEQLDGELRQKGNNREATVYSDIAVHLPGLGRPVFIDGETHGTVADSPPDFEPSLQHPWLTPQTFNGWFIPDGAEKRLGAMSFEESLRYDFRVKSLNSLIDRLEEYAAILNLSGGYTVRRPKVESGPLLFKDLNHGPLYMVVGRLCAGKTTLGEYASAKHSWLFIEASDIMRMLAQNSGISGSSSYQKARELLTLQGPDIIARQIVAMFGSQLDEATIITGYRTIEEIKYTKTKLPGCKIVFIEASERTRFERHLARGRLEDIKTLSDFRVHDQQQWNFGLLGVAKDLADIVVENEGSLKEFYEQIDALLAGTYEKVSAMSETTSRAKRLRGTRLFRCLKSLDRFSEPATSAEISDATIEETATVEAETLTTKISPRHVNWILSKFPELARRVEVKGDVIRYRIMPAGKALVEMVSSVGE